MNDARRSLCDEFISPGTIGLYVRCQQNYELLDTFSLENSPILNFTGIRPAGATLMIADRRADMKNLTDAFRVYKNALDKVYLEHKVYLPLPYDCQNKQRSFP
jgi:hypothetical protein